MNNDNQTTLSTQGDTNEKEDQLGGTTNLSLDQLKEEGGIGGFSEDNPDGLTDEDDLNEIRADDDLGEPDVDEYEQDDDGSETDIDEYDQDDVEGDELADDPDTEDTEDEDSSSMDADGNGGFPDDASELRTNS